MERHTDILLDVLDRVLDKGIVIDAWARIRVGGIDLATVEARIVVASVETYLRYADAIGQTPPAARPSLWGPSEGRRLAEDIDQRLRLPPEDSGCGG